MWDIFFKFKYFLKFICKEYFKNMKLINDTTCDLIIKAPLSGNNWNNIDKALLVVWRKL